MKIEYDVLTPLKDIVDLIDGTFSKLISVAYPPSYKELSQILTYLVKYSTNSKLYINSIKKKIQQPALTDRHIKKFNSFVLPSNRNPIFNTLQLYLTSASAVEFFALVKRFLSSLQPDLFIISKNFLMGPSFSMLMLKVITNQQSDLISDEFYHEFAVNFLSNFRRAIYVLTLPFGIFLSMKVPDLMNHFIHTIIVSPGLISTIEKIYGEIRVKQTTKYQQELLDVKFFEECSKLFFRYITIDSRKLHYQIGKNAADLPSFFFNNMVQKVYYNFLAVFCLLKQIFASIEEKIKREVITVVSASNEVYLVFFKINIIFFKLVLVRYF